MRGWFILRFQPVDATHWPNRSAGVSKSDAGKHRAAMRSLKTGTTSSEVVQSRKIAMGLRRLEVELQDKLTL